MRTIRVRAVIGTEDGYLFVRHPGSRSWVLPGGKLEPGEAVTTGLIREIVEELGIVPEVGKLLYVHQLFRNNGESLEFFFEILNGEAFMYADPMATTHGATEIEELAFLNPGEANVLPDFLQHIAAHKEAAEFPYVYTVHA